LKNPHLLFKILYHDNSEADKMIPNCIVGDFDSIRSEVQDYYSNKNVKMFMKQDQDTTDLEKCLYVSLEKISEIQVENDSENYNFNYSDNYNDNFNYLNNYGNDTSKINENEFENLGFSCDYIEHLKKNKKKYSIIILGASGGRIDHTFSAYSQVFKYLNMYSYEFAYTEILMMSKSSCSLYLKPGKNIVYLTKTWEKKNQGFSIIPLFGEGKLKIYENEENEKNKSGNLLLFRIFIKKLICIKNKLNFSKDYEI